MIKKLILGEKYIISNIKRNDVFEICELVKIEDENTETTVYTFRSNKIDKQFQLFDHNRYIFRNDLYSVYIYDTPKMFINKIKDEINILENKIQNEQKTIKEIINLDIKNISEEIKNKFGKYCETLFIDERNLNDIWFLFGLKNEYDNLKIRTKIRNYFEEYKDCYSGINYKFILNTFTKESFIKVKSLI